MSRNARRSSAAPRALPVGIASLAFVACLEYSPHAIPQGEADRDVHRKSLERLFATPPPDGPVRFAVIGDTQGDFNETEEVAELIRARTDLSFVVQVGDFTHQGIAPEFVAMNALFRRMGIPYFVVVGNHDLLANGGDIYDHVFGTRNLVFTYGGTRFVLFDTNAVEYGFGTGTAPDLELLRTVLSGAPAEASSRLTLYPPGPGAEPFAQAILFGHIDPSNLDWDPALREPYFALLQEQGVQLSFYGHGHKPHEFERDGSRFVLPGAVDKRTYVVVSVHPDGRTDVVRERF